MNKKIVLIALVLGFFSLKSMATVWYVDSANIWGVQNGFTWQTAFQNIQPAMAEASSGDSIWIARGGYVDGFAIKQGVKMLGGFQNTDTSEQQRNWQINVSTIRGSMDCSGNDITSTTVLDGFRLNAPAPHLYVNASSPIIKNCTFVGVDGTLSLNGGAVEIRNSRVNFYNCKFSSNVAEYGGAIYNSNSNVIIRKCSFSLNKNDVGLNGGANGGGAICNSGSSKIKIDSCTFYGNYNNINTSSTSKGGAIFNNSNDTIIISNSTFTNNKSSAPNGNAYGGAIFNNNNALVQITNCAFSGNYAATEYGSYKYYGGAICNINNNGMPVVISDCTFTGNKGGSNYYNSAIYYDSYGGAIYNGALVAATIQNCSFSENFVQAGGAVYNDATEASTKIINCFFTGNKAKYGGGIYNKNASPMIVNANFSKNLAEQNGGAYYNSGSSPRIINNTIVSNKATTSGSLMYNTSNSNPVVLNSILWGNYSGIFNSNSTSFSIMSYSLVQGFTANPMAYNLDGTTNPLFVDTSGTGNYQLQSTSPCINMGNNDSIPSGTMTDLADAARIYNTTVDMGAYEFGSTPLPVRFISLTGKKQADQSNLLEWYTFNEKAESFELQRSVDGKTFVAFYQTAANTDQQKYSYTDELPEDYGYYRVIIKEHDGNVMYSNIAFIAGENATQLFTVYPNPATDIITINWADATLLHTQATLTDAYGRVVKTVTIESRSQQLSLSGLAQGIYILKMQNGQAVKIVKE